MNSIINGNCIDKLKTIESESVDVVFADPPFNLNKKYKSSKDRLAEEEYLNWTYEWLDECVRVLKPTGALFLHNIPRWLTYCSAFLNDKMYFQHWISWDAPSAPMGKSLQPAHYGILYYTKEPRHSKYKEIRYPHKRCRKKKCNHLLKDYGGKKASVHPYGPLVSDVWTDIHRIKHRRSRDEHPCQLPIHLVERIVLMASEEGDTILDPFLGTGTTAIAAKKLGRKYIGIELDPSYHEIAVSKVAEAETTKLGDSWVSIYRNKVVTVRSEDWDRVRNYYTLPDNPKEIDFTSVKRDKK